MKRGWYNIKSGEKKTLKKPMYSLKLSICRRGGPGIWAVMLGRCLTIQVMFKGILNVSPTQEILIWSQLQETALCNVSFIQWALFLSYLFHYNYSSREIKNQDPALHAESKFIPLPLKIALLSLFCLDSFIFCAVTWRKDTVLKFLKTTCKHGTCTQVICMSSYKIGMTTLISIYIF